LIDEGDADQWVDKISFLLKNKNVAQEMGKSAREFIIEEFSWDVIAKRFVNIIEPYLRENATKKPDKNS
jgi:glycosyltransferase involved in cell wall biosynthesis